MRLPMYPLFANLPHNCCPQLDARAVRMLLNVLLTVLMNLMLQTQGLKPYTCT